MSKGTEIDTPTETNIADETSKKPRLDLHDQILSWPPSRIATDELVRIFEHMQEKTADASESVDGLITAQIKLEVKIKMDILQQKTGNRDRLGPEINTYLLPWTSASRECIAKIACEKMQGATSGDLAAQVSEAVETTIVEKFQKGIDKQLRDLMK